MGSRRAKIKVSARLYSFWRLLGKIPLLAFPSFWKPPACFGSWLLSSVLKASTIRPPVLPFSSTVKDASDYHQPTPIPQNNLSISFNSVPPAKPFHLVR